CWCAVASSGGGIPAPNPAASACSSRCGSSRKVRTRARSWGPLGAAVSAYPALAPRQPQGRVSPTRPSPTRTTTPALPFSTRLAG
ncbi:MAG: hypothetical protein MI924_06405, partial [Chloroflexales bacterium]|nr:hypothetical protein [Chloroflexales bacterium]